VTVESVLHHVLPAHVAVLRASPLGHRADDLAAASGTAVRLAERPFRSAVSLRTAPDGRAAARVAAALGCALPGPGASATASGGRRALWLGPDEWLVTGPDGDAPGLVRLLTGALSDDRDGDDGDGDGGAERGDDDRGATHVDGRAAYGSVVDVSANRTTLELAGPAARAVLEKGITLDLHPRVFGAGSAAATTLARTLVIVTQVSEEPAYHLLVRPSFASYLADWLLDACAEFAGRPE
jgi:sarcosine oxidase subunit gamma